MPVFLFKAIETAEGETPAKRAMSIVVTFANAITSESLMESVPNFISFYNMKKKLAIKLNSMKKPRFILDKIFLYC